MMTHRQNEKTEDEALYSAAVAIAEKTLRTWDSQALDDFKNGLEALIDDCRCGVWEREDDTPPTIHPDRLSYEQRGLSPERRARV